MSHVHSNLQTCNKQFMSHFGTCQFENSKYFFLIIINQIRKDSLIFFCPFPTYELISFVQLLSLKIRFRNTNFARYWVNASVKQVVSTDKYSKSSERFIKLTNALNPNKISICAQYESAIT